MLRTWDNLISVERIKVEKATQTVTKVFRVEIITNYIQNIILIFAVINTIFKPLYHPRERKILPRWNEYIGELFYDEREQAAI